MGRRHLAIVAVGALLALTSCGNKEQSPRNAATTAGATNPKDAVLDSDVFLSDPKGTAEDYITGFVEGEGKAVRGARCASGSDNETFYEFNCDVSVFGEERLGGRIYTIYVNQKTYAVFNEYLPRPEEATGPIDPN